jgi:hypothetical protein
LVKISFFAYFYPVRILGALTPEMNKGFLDFQIWCGNMCSMGDRLEIEKNNGKWKVIKRYPGPVS